MRPALNRYNDQLHLCLPPTLESLSATLAQASERVPDRRRLIRLAYRWSQDSELRVSAPERRSRRASCLDENRQVVARASPTPSRRRDRDQPPDTTRPKIQRSFLSLDAISSARLRRSSCAGVHVGQNSGTWNNSSRIAIRVVC